MVILKRDNQDFKQFDDWDDMMRYMHRNHSYSWDWAQKHEGWSAVEVENAPDTVEKLLAIPMNPEVESVKARFKSNIMRRVKASQTKNADAQTYTKWSSDIHLHQVLGSPALRPVSSEEGYFSYNVPGREYLLASTKVRDAIYEFATLVRSYNNL